MTIVATQARCRTGEANIMSHYQQRDAKDLYRPKDIMFTVIGVICAIAAALILSRTFTGWAGI
jgi:hypothetical protein